MMILNIWNGWPKKKKELTKKIRLKSLCFLEHGNRFEYMRASWEKISQYLKMLDHTKLQDKNKLKFSVDWEDGADYQDPLFPR